MHKENRYGFIWGYITIRFLRCSKPEKENARREKQLQKEVCPAFFGQTSFADLYIILSQKVIKRLCRHSVCAFKGMNIDVRGCNIGVSEP